MYPLEVLFKPDNYIIIRLFFNHLVIFYKAPKVLFNTFLVPQLLDIIFTTIFNTIRIVEIIF
jgi:hypothetical protein